MTILQPFVTLVRDEHPWLSPSPLDLRADLEAVGKYLHSLPDDERGRAEFNRTWDAIPWDDRTKVSHFLTYWAKIHGSDEARDRERIEEIKRDKRNRREADREDRRAQLEALGERGWHFPSLRAAHQELDGERQQPTIGTWSRLLSREEKILLGMDEGDGHAILYSRKVNLIFGPSESGKSMFAFAIVAQEVKAGKYCVVVDFEDDEYGLVARLTDLGLDIEEIDPEGTKPGGVYYVPARLGMQEEDFMLIRERLAHHGADLTFVLVDAVTEAMAADGLNPDKGAEVAAWAASMPKRFATLGPGVAIIDHTNLTDADRAGGSQHKKSMVDGVSLKVSRRETFIPGKGGAARIYIAKDRIGSIRRQSVPASVGEMEYRGTFRMNPEGELEPFAMIGRNPTDLDRPRDEPDRARDERTSEERLSDLAEEITHIVRANPGITKVALRERIEQQASTDAKQAAVEEAVRLGRIRIERGHRGAVEHHPAIPKEGVQETI